MINKLDLCALKLDLLCKSYSYLLPEARLRRAKLKIGGESKYE